jgi:hypothetical protein
LSLVVHALAFFFFLSRNKQDFSVWFPAFEVLERS